MMSNYPYKASSSSSSKDDGMGGLGLLLGESLPDTIKIEHVFTLKFGASDSKWEKPLRRWIDNWFDLTKNYSESFHLIAAGIGSYFFFLGVSKVIHASRSGSNDNNSKSTKKKDKDKQHKDKDKDDASFRSKTKTIKISNDMHPSATSILFDSAPPSNSDQIV
jgi:hypothetical protein